MLQVNSTYEVMLRVDSVGARFQHALSRERER